MLSPMGGRMFYLILYIYTIGTLSLALLSLPCLSKMGLQNDNHDDHLGFTPYKG